MVYVLGIRPRCIKKAVFEEGYSIIELDIISKTPEYHGPGGKTKE